MTRFMAFVLMIILILNCHPKDKAINTSEDEEFSEADLPTESVISIPYSITSVRNVFKFDEYHNDKKYLAEIDGYDENNIQIEHKSFYTDGTLEQHIVNIYDKGRLKETYRLQAIGRHDEALYKTSYKYGSNGKLLSTVLHDYQRRIEKDPPTDIIDESYYGKTKSWGEIQSERFWYDTTGNLVQKTTTWKNRKDEINYSYDQLGNVIEEAGIESGYRIKGNSLYFQDSSISAHATYNYDGTIWFEYINKKRYDKNKNLVDDQWIDKSEQKLSSRRLNTYDSQNRIIKEEYVTNLGTSVFTVYEYEKFDRPVNSLFTVSNH